MNTKFLFILLGLVIFSFLLLQTGCGRKIETPSPKSKIVFATGDSGESLEFLKELIKGFENKYPDIDVHIEYIPSSGYSTKLLTGFVTGEAPDVFMVYNPVELLYYAKRGGLLSIDNFIAEDREFKKEDFFTVGFSMCTFDDKLYALAKEGNPYILFYNCNLFDEAGLEYPNGKWTWDDYYNTAKHLTRDTNGDGRIDIYGSWNLISTDMLFTMARQLDGNIFGSKGNPLFGTLEVTKSLEFMDRLCREKLAPRPGDVTDIFQHEFFAMGRVAMMPHFPYMIREMNKTITKFKYDIAPIPIFLHERRRVESICSSYAIYSKTKYPKESWLLTKYLGGEMGQRIVAKAKYGIPLLKSIAYSDEFGPPPDNIRVAVEAMEYGEPFPNFVGIREMQEIIERELSLVTIGKKDPRTALQDITKGIQRLDIKGGKE